jgi:hypothetical protein
MHFAVESAYLPFSSKSIYMACYDFVMLLDPLREYRTPKKLSKLTPEVIHEQETNPKREQEGYS